jgi:hypothetical protein
VLVGTDFSAGGLSGRDALCMRQDDRARVESSGGGLKMCAQQGRVQRIGAHWGGGVVTAWMAGGGECTWEQNRGAAMRIEEGAA